MTVLLTSFGCCCWFSLLCWLLFVVPLLLGTADVDDKLNGVCESLLNCLVANFSWPDFFLEGECFRATEYLEEDNNLEKK